MSKTNNSNQNLKPSLKQIMLGISLTILLLLVTSCVGNTQGSFCLLYNPVYTDIEDTEQTKTQVDDNNIVWEELCE